LTPWSFERAARQRVKAEVGASEKLREERRLARAAARGRYRIRPWLIRICIMGVVLAFVTGAGSRTLEYLVAITFLWTLGEMFLRATLFHAALYYDPALIVYDFLPIAEPEIFRKQWKRFLGRTWWGYFSFAVAYGMILVHSGIGWNAVPGGLALGAVQWLLTMAMAVCLVAFARPKQIAALAWPFQAAAFLLVWFGSDQPRLCQWLSGLAWCAPPLGWILQSLGVSDNSGVFHRVLPGLMSAAVLALAPFAFRRVRHAFEQCEPRHSTDGRTLEVIQFGERKAQSPGHASVAIQGRQFLAGFDWQTAGILERLFARFLNSRERTIAEFMLAGIPRWTAVFKRLFLILFVAAVVFWPLRRLLSSISPAFLVIMGLSWVGGFVVSLRGFSLPPGSGLPSPYYAIYPIGFWELTRVVLKINLLKSSICLPYLLLVCAFFGGIQSSALGSGLKCIALALTVQPLLVIGAISPNTNDTRKPGLAFVVVALMLVMLGAGITFFFVATWWIVALAGFIMAALSVLELVLYGRWFNRSRFDLVPLKRSDIEKPA
jgi:hypothetical protein